MQTTSEKYKQIIETAGHWFETKVNIAGKEVPENKIISVERDAQGISEAGPSVGGAMAASLNLTIIDQDFTIPRMGQIVAYIRACTDTMVSEWLQAGTFFVDTRMHDKTADGVELLRITAYDAMLKGEQAYPDTAHSWPYPDKYVVEEIAAALGVTVDKRTNSFLTAAYQIELPASYTIRETLEHIAGAYGGNFVITAENKLLFVPLYGLDVEGNIDGNYLAVDGTTEALLFGDEGWYILV